MTVINLPKPDPDKPSGHAVAAALDHLNILKGFIAGLQIDWLAEQLRQHEAFHKMIACSCGGKCDAFREHLLRLLELLRPAQAEVRGHMRDFHGVTVREG